MKNFSFVVIPKEDEHEMQHMKVLAASLEEAQEILEEETSTMGLINPIIISDGKGDDDSFIERFEQAMKKAMDVIGD